jgi:3-oxoacyl-[acyl-carrier-protein] synthase III
LSLTVRPVVGRRAKITALGTYVPPEVLTNKDLEKMVDTNDQWIMERTGIRERHVLAKGLGVSDMCVEAAKKCLAARGIEPSEVEVIIVGTVTPDMMFPSTACLVQDKIGAKGAWGFDVSAGCSGFVFALQAGVKLVESGAHKKVLVCGADANTRMTDYTDRTTCVLFGDGGGAVLIEPAEEGEIGFIDFVHEIDGSGGVSLNLKGGGSLNPSTPRDGGQEDALHLPGWAGGVQVCGAQDGRGDDQSCWSATA